MNNSESRKTIPHVFYRTLVSFFAWVICIGAYFGFDKINHSYWMEWRSLDPNADYSAWIAAGNSMDFYQGLRDLSIPVGLISALICLIAGYYFFSKSPASESRKRIALSFIMANLSILPLAGAAYFAYMLSKMSW